MRFSRIDFKRDARWVLIVAGLPLVIGILLALVIPALFP
jgi:hypothetical protein